MTREEFIKAIGKEVDGLSEEEIDLYFAITAKTFGVFFDRHKREKMLATNG
jgi:hypothetical protein